MIDDGSRSGAAVGGLMVFQQPEIELYQRLVEAARARLAELELGGDIWVGAVLNEPFSSSYISLAK